MSAYFSKHIRKGPKIIIEMIKHNFVLTSKFPLFSVKMSNSSAAQLESCMKLDLLFSRRRVLWMDNLVLNHIHRRGYHGFLFGKRGMPLNYGAYLKNVIRRVHR